MHENYNLPSHIVIASVILRFDSRQDQLSERPDYYDTMFQIWSSHQLCIASHSRALSPETAVLRVQEIVPLVKTPGLIF